MAEQLRTGHCIDHASIRDKLEEISDNVLKIIKSLQGEIGSHDPGIVAMITDMDKRLTRLERAQSTFGARAWDVAKLVIAAAIGGIAAAIGVKGHP